MITETQLELAGSIQEALNDAAALADLIETVTEHCSQLDSSIWPGVSVAARRISDLCVEANVNAAKLTDTKRATKGGAR